jgi:hypothetical protein
MLRSCYLSKFVLRPGGPAIDGGWYFTSDPFLTSHNTFGSLIWWNDNSSVFSGVGEVSRGAWRDGSPLPCVPGVPCLSSQYANYDQVVASAVSPPIFNSLIQVSGDKWGTTLSFGGYAFTFFTECGGISPGLQNISIKNATTSSSTVRYPGISLNPAYPAEWSFPTVAGSPFGWPGGTVLVRTQCSSGVVTSGHAPGLNSSSLSLTLAGVESGDSLLAFYFQNGTDVSGSGSLPTPAISPSGTPLNADPNKRSYAWAFVNVTAPVTVTVSGIANADMSDLYCYVVRTRPSASILASLFRNAVTAASVMTTNAITFTGDHASLLAFFSQHRNAATSLSAPTFSLPTGGFSVSQSGSRSVVGGTPLFEILANACLQTFVSPAGTYTAGLTSSRALQYDSGILAIR